MSHDTWVHRGVRRLVRPLVDTPITPNHITTLRLAGGIAAAAAVASGTDEGFQLGALLFVVSFVLDRADGELARLSGKTSAWGHMFDLWSDAACNALIFIGLGIGLANGGLGAWATPMGFLSGGAIAVILWAVVRVEAQDGARGAELGSIGGFDPDDAVLFVPLALALGWAEPLLQVAAVAAPVFAVLFLWIFRTQLRLRAV